jgi:hypothetical protein
MADVASTLAAWSSTDASNSPSGATTIGTGLDDNLRAIQAVIVRGLSHKGSDIASTTTTDVGAVEGLMNDITGDETVTGLGTVRAGILKVLKFEGAVTLTHNTTSLILPGASNIVAVDGDVGIFISEGSGNWRCLHYMKTAGGVLGPVLSAETATTSGTSHDFSIPLWAKKITVNLAGVSTNGTSNIIIQLGDGAPGIETSGYLGSTGFSGAGGTLFTDGFGIDVSGPAATSVFSGSMVITLQNAASFRWTALGVFGRSDSGAVYLSAGSKALSAALTTVRLTTQNGTDAFDAGAASVLYE